MRFEFSVGPIHAVLIAGKRRVVDRLLTIADPGAAKDISFRMHLRDGLIHFLTTDEATGLDMFPAGLMDRLAHRLEKRGHEVVINYDPKPARLSPVTDDYLLGITMRGYQVDAVNAGLEYQRGLLWIATNGGKSAVIAALCGKMVREGRMTVVVVVPNAYLLTQTSKDIANFLGDVRVGRAGDGIRELDCEILVATYQTLLQGVPKRAGNDYDPDLAAALSSAGCVIVDEAHHAASPAYSDILHACTNALYRFGCSGSMDKSDKRKSRSADEKAQEHRWRMESHFGPVLSRIDNQFLIDQGFSAKPRVFMVNDRRAFGPVVPTPKPRPGRRVVNVYQHVFNLAVINDSRFRKSIARCAEALLNAGRPPFVFSHSVDHLIALRDTFDALNIPCRLLTGKDSVFKRGEVVKRFEKRGDFAVLTSPIFDEGASIPAIRGVIFAGARKASTELLQRLGRGLRKKTDGDNVVIVIDFAPVHSTLLHGHAEARLAEFRHQGQRVEFISDIASIGAIPF